MPAHSFEETTFHRLTYCDECGRLLWGLKKQGLQCIDCEFVCHSGCAKDAGDCVEARQGNGSVPGAVSAVSTAATGVSLPLTGAQVEDAIVSAAILSTDLSLPVSHYLATLPPLHPQTTTRNFTRFVSRCGPVFGFRDKVILLLNWDKPIDTFVALVAYIIICFYPKLLLFVPQVVILHILMSGYYNRQNGDLPAMHGSDQRVSAMKSDTATAAASTAAATAATSAEGSGKRAYLGNLASSLFPVFDETSPEYGRNLQNMQNMMGETSDAYDVIQAHAYLWDWSDEELCSQIVLFVVLSMFALAAAVYFVSFRTICLVGGIGAFLGNTRFAKHLVAELVPLLLPIAKKSMETAAARQKQTKQWLHQQQAIHEVSLYENQAWAQDKNRFTSHLQSTERGPWSDLSGTQKMPSNVQKSIPPSKTMWLDQEWKLDADGAWKNALGIETRVRVDHEGWAYYNDDWIATDGFQPGYSTRRRRRWTRKCQQLAW